MSSAAPLPARKGPRSPQKDSPFRAVGFANLVDKGVPKHPDPEVDRALQLPAFEKAFVVEDFMSTLSDRLVTSSRGNTGAFDPVPFIQSFSPALDVLLALRKKASQKQETLNDEVKRAESEYSVRLRELDGGFDTIGSAFSALESKVNGVGRTAVRIGEQLESLHQSRSVAQSTSLLLSYYLSLCQAPAPSAKGADGEDKQPQTPLETLFATRTSRDGRARLAVILRRLITLSKDVYDSATSALESSTDTADTTGKVNAKLKADLERAERVREEVEKYGERFEKECLRLFDRSYRKGDVRMMAHCAKTLQDFNGGTSCVQIYVNQHDFFISKDRILEDAHQANGANGDADGDGGKAVDIWPNLGLPDELPPTTEPGLALLFDEIRETVSQEAQIIQAVFPMKEEVMKVFLQRVFAQVIQQHLEQLFSRAAGIGNLALLRMLRVTHSMCAALVEDLKQYDMSSSVVVLDAAADATTKNGANPTVLSVMLDSAMEEIYVPFLEGQRYVDLESKWLREGYKALLTKFQRYHESVLKMKTGGLLDRVVDRLTNVTTKDATPSGTSSASAAASAAAAWLNKMGGSTGPGGVLPNKDGAAPSGTSTPMKQQHIPDEKVYETDGVMTLATAERMLKWHAEAIGRIVELSGPGDVPKNVFTLSRVLADHIGRNYLELQLDSATTKLDIHDSKAEPDLVPLRSLRQTDLILHLWQKYIATASLPLASSAVIVRREILSTNSGLVKRIEGKVNVIVQKTLDACVAHLSTLLQKQKRLDYRPKDDDLSFARTTTEPCEACCEFLESFREAAVGGLGGGNLEAVLVEIGIAFHSLLLDHYKKFPVNPTGGLMLTKDLAAYQDLFHHFPLPSSSTLLAERYDMLRQLGNSFIVQPDVLKSYLTESYLGRIDMRLLRPYLMMRSDWLIFAPQFPGGSAEEDTPSRSSTVEASSDAGGGESSAVAGSGTKGLFKGNRLSMGVGVASMGRLRDLLKDVDNFAFGDGQGGHASQGSQGYGGQGQRTSVVRPLSVVSNSGSGSGATQRLVVRGRGGQNPQESFMRSPMVMGPML